MNLSFNQSQIVAIKSTNDIPNMKGRPQLATHCPQLATMKNQQTFASLATNIIWSVK